MSVGTTLAIVAGAVFVVFIGVKLAKGRTRPSSGGGGGRDDGGRGEGHGAIHHLCHTVERPDAGPHAHHDHGTVLRFSTPVSVWGRASRTFIIFEHYARLLRRASIVSCGRARWGWFRRARRLREQRRRLVSRGPDLRVRPNALSE